MANAYVEVDQIANEALIHLEDALIISNLTARDKTSDFNTTPSGYKVGDTVRIKTRPDYVATEFDPVNGVTVQSVRSSARDMTIEKLLDVSVEITAKEKALDFEGFTNEVVIPATYRLAEKCDNYVGTKILEAAGLYASTDLFTDAADMALARSAANLQQLSPTGRFCLVNDTLEARLLGKTYFNTYNNRGDSGRVVFDEARMGHAMNMDFYQSMNFPSWSLAAAGTGTATTDNAAGTKNLVGNTDLTVDSANFSVNTFPAGTRIKIAGVRRPLIVKTLVNGNPATVIPLVDPITEIIPDNAAVTIIASGQTNLSLLGAIFDDESLALAMPMLDTPSDKPSFTVSNNGYSIRVTTGYDMKYKKEMMSLDLLIGAKAYDNRRITLLAEY